MTFWHTEQKINSLLYLDLDIIKKNFRKTKSRVLQKKPRGFSKKITNKLELANIITYG